MPDRVGLAQLCKYLPIDSDESTAVVDGFLEVLVEPRVATHLRLSVSKKQGSLTGTLVARRDRAATGQFQPTDNLAAE
jgi:hypothetical protein